MGPKYSPKKVQELAASYALGVLDEKELDEFERLLREGHKSCETDLQTFNEVVNWLGYNIPLASPPPGLKERLLSKIGEKDRAKRKLEEPHGFLYVRSEEGEWNEIAEGVSLKPLSYDSARQYVTALVRMNAKTRFPKHRYAEAEQCYVIDGDIEMGGQLFREGDYIRAGAGSIHEGIYSESGCVLLILSSQRNEILE